MAKQNSNTHKPDLKAALKKAQASVKETASAKGPYPREAWNRGLGTAGFVIQPCLGGPVETTIELIQHVLGEDRTIPGLEWVGAVQDAGASIMDLLAGVSVKNPDGTFVESWWTKEAGPTGLISSFNLQVRHTRARGVRALFADDEGNGAKGRLETIRSQEPGSNEEWVKDRTQGIFIHIETLADDQGGGPVTTLLCELADDLAASQGIPRSGDGLTGFRLPTRGPWFETGREEGESRAAWLARSLDDQYLPRSPVILAQWDMLTQFEAVAGFSDCIRVVGLSVKEFAEVTAEIKRRSKERGYPVLTDAATSFVLSHGRIVIVGGRPTPGNVTMAFQALDCGPDRKLDGWHEFSDSARSVMRAAPFITWLRETMLRLLEAHAADFPGYMDDGRARATPDEARADLETQGITAIEGGAGFDLPGWRELWGSTAQALPAQLETAILDATDELAASRKTLATMTGKLKEVEAPLADALATIDAAKAEVEKLSGLLEQVRKAVKAGKAVPLYELPHRVLQLVEREKVQGEQLESTRADLAGTRIERDAYARALEGHKADLSMVKSELEAMRVDRVELPVDTPVPEPVPELLVPDDLPEALDPILAGEDITPAYFATASSPSTLPEVATLYREWVLGQGAYGGARRSRVEAGVITSWGLETLEGDGPLDLEGDHGLNVSIRGQDDTWLLRFGHRDKTQDTAKWWSLVRLTKASGGTRVEHGVIWTPGEGGGRFRRPDFAGAPTVVRDFLRAPGDKKPWCDFRGDARWLTEDAVRRFVTAVILDPERDLPVIYVSRTTKGGVPLVDPDALAKALDGLAVVYTQAFANPFILTDALRAGGVANPKLSCYDGGVRMFLPGFGPDADLFKNRLWLGDTLTRLPHPSRVARIAREVATASVTPRVPPSFARVIEDFDLAKAKEAVASQAAHGDASGQAVAYRAQIRALEQALQEARGQAELIPSVLAQLQEAQSHAQIAIEVNGLLEAEKTTLSAQLEEKRQELGRTKGHLAVASALPEERQADGEARNLALGLLDEKWSQVGAIARLVQAAYPDQLKILDSGLESADECNFEFPERAQELLVKLATHYRDALLRGGDAQAAKVFGEAFASKEPDNLSTAGRRARTFRWGTEEILMETHLKLTRGFSRTSSAQVLRIHFHWDADSRRVIVGHIGRHLTP